MRVRVRPVAPSRRPDAAFVRQFRRGAVSGCRVGRLTRRAACISKSHSPRWNAAARPSNSARPCEPCCSVCASSMNSFHALAASVLSGALLAVRRRRSACTSAPRTAARMKGGASCSVGAGWRSSSTRSTPSKALHASASAKATRCGQTGTDRHSSLIRRSPARRQRAVTRRDRRVCSECGVPVWDVPGANAHQRRCKHAALPQPKFEPPKRLPYRRTSAWRRATCAAAGTYSPACAFMQRASALGSGTGAAGIALSASADATSAAAAP